MKKLHSIQALRAIAVLLLVIDHCVLFKESFTFRGDAAAQLGAMGAQIFFLISGLIMFHSSYERFNVKGAPLNFMLRRIIRVVPMYWLMTCLTVLYNWRHGSFEPLQNIVKSLFFIPYLPSSSHYMVPVLYQGWSLNFEMLFYAVFSLCLYFNRGLGITILSLFFLCLAGFGVIDHPVYEEFFAQNALDFFTSPIMALFIFGVWLGVIVERFHLPLRMMPHPLLITVFMVVITSDVFIGLVGQLLYGMEYKALFWSLSLGCVFFCVFNTSKGPVFNLFDRLGDASYSIYLIHVFALKGSSKLFFLLPQEMQQLGVFIFISVCVACSAGYVFYIALERPLTRYLLSLFNANKPDTLRVQG